MEKSVQAIWSYQPSAWNLSMAPRTVSPHFPAHSHSVVFLAPASSLAMLLIQYYLQLLHVEPQYLAQVLSQHLTEVLTFLPTSFCICLCQPFLLKALSSPHHSSLAGNKSQAIPPPDISLNHFLPVSAPHNKLGLAHCFCASLSVKTKMFKTCIFWRKDWFSVGSWKTDS